MAPEPPVARTSRKVYLRHEAARLPVPTKVAQEYWTDLETPNLRLRIRTRNEDVLPGLS